MKAKVPHEVPLPSQALDIVRGVGYVAGSVWLFPNNRNTGPFHSFGHVKRVLVRTIAKARTASGIQFMEPWRLHDLRRSVRTGLSELGIRPDVAERVIAHIPGNDISKTYDVSAYRKEKREALQAWANHVERVTNPQQNVIEMRR